MFFPFECKKCQKKFWEIRFNSEEKTHIITCANCGDKEILEDIFGNKRRSKSVNKKQRIKKETETTNEAAEPVESVRISAQ